MQEKFSTKVTCYFVRVFLIHSHNYVIKTWSQLTIYQVLFPLLPKRKI